MNEFKGTKGKWYVSQPNGKSICAETDNVLGYEVVVVQDGFISKYDQKAKANALLVSKSPEMLEMLKNVYLQMDAVGRRMSDDNDAKQGLLGRADQIHKLIKEATEI